MAKQSKTKSHIIYMDIKDFHVVPQKKSLRLESVTNYSIFVKKIIEFSKKKVFTWNQSRFFNYNVLKIPDGRANQ